MHILKLKLRLMTESGQKSDTWKEHTRHILVARSFYSNSYSTCLGIRENPIRCGNELWIVAANGRALGVMGLVHVPKIYFSICKNPF